ncbi:MAG: hypothetical protein U0800_15140 [Isosphaeraceae bacterium]
MAQCQTKPSGRCTMEPPCPPGDCYMYRVLSQERAAETKATTPEPALVGELCGSSLTYKRGPYTEKEPWDRTKLAILNAVLDTMEPGARLVVDRDDQGHPTAIHLGKVEKIFSRPRDLPHCLRELADWLDGGQDG